MRTVILLHRGSQCDELRFAANCMWVNHLGRVLQPLKPWNPSGDHYLVDPLTWESLRQNHPTEVLGVPGPEDLWGDKYWWLPVPSFAVLCYTAKDNLCNNIRKNFCTNEIQHPNQSIKCSWRYIIMSFYTPRVMLCFPHPFFKPVPTPVIECSPSQYCWEGRREVPGSLHIGL